jgi:hypothetical protein
VSDVPFRRRPRTPRNIAKFITEGVNQVKAEQASTADLDAADHYARAPRPEELEDPLPPLPPLPTPEPEPEPVAVRPQSAPTYRAPDVDPWEILRRSLPPEALAALEQVTGKPQMGAGNAPWFECWDVLEGRPTGHPPFQAFVKPGQHVYCPWVDDVTGTCGRKTVKPLENYIPAAV